MKNEFVTKTSVGGYDLNRCLHQITEAIVNQVDSIIDVADCQLSATGEEWGIIYNAIVNHAKIEAAKADNASALTKCGSAVGNLIGYLLLFFMGASSIMLTVKGLVALAGWVF